MRTMDIKKRKELKKAHRDIAVGGFEPRAILASLLVQHRVHRICLFSCTEHLILRVTSIRCEPSDEANAGMQCKSAWNNRSDALLSLSTVF